MEEFENGLNPIRPYTNDREPISITQLPISRDNRVKTDVCCTVFTSLFAITMFIMAIVCMKPSQLIKMTYPTDQIGRHCTLDNSGYNYLYFTSLNDPNKRLCVSECPKGNERQLKCWPSDTLSCTVNSKANYEVQIYPSVATETRIGLFCFPEDPVLKEKMLKHAHLTTRLQFVDTYRTIWMSFLITFTLGSLFIVLLSFYTTFVVYGTILFGGLGAIAIGVTFLILSTHLGTILEVIKIVFCAVLIIFGLFIIWPLFGDSRDIRLCIIYLNRAFDCLKTFWALGFLIPLFFLLMFGLVALFGFQLLAYWSSSTLNFYPDYVYDVPEGIFADVTTVINFIELIWGFSFLKEAFSFIVSGTTVTWFFKRQHSFLFGTTNLFRFHWGSVVAGSFLLIFLYIFDVFYDMLKPRESNKPWLDTFTKICCCCHRILGLVRSEAMAYINITGVPYCNASRWCERMSYLSTLYEGSQSINRFFRMSAHILLAFLGTIYSIIELESFTETPNIPALMSNFLLCMFVATFFISLPADMAEAILTCTFVQNYLEDRDMAPDSFRKPRSPEDGYQVYYTEN